MIKISEIDTEKKLESFRKRNKIIFEFNTISATGKNGSIIHYRASKKTCREIKRMMYTFVIREGNTLMELPMSQELFLLKKAPKN